MDAFSYFNLSTTNNNHSKVKTIILINFNNSNLNHEIFLKKYIHLKKQINYKPIKFWKTVMKQNYKK